MLYRRFGKTNYKLSALGIGTNRFLIGKNVEEDICKAAKLVYAALKSGANYIDVAYNYSKGYAYRVLKLAFEMAEKEKIKYYVTVKSAYKTDKTADAAYHRVQSSIREMGLHKATFFVCWGIQSYEEYEKIMQPCGMYEGALRAKKEGLVDSICFSTHAPIEDIIRIMKSGYFDGVTISYSALNYKQYREVLKCARENEMGVITMNSLGGGIIPQNEDFFEFLKTNADKNIEEGALRFIYAHNEITCCLSGMSSFDELRSNIRTFDFVDSNADLRLSKVDMGMQQLTEYCSGCNYCFGCPKNIPIREYMQALNTVHFPFGEGSYNRNDQTLLTNISITRKLNKDFFNIPESTVNPCIHCGMCESKCTQHLPIRKKIETLYKIFDTTGYSRESQKNRLKELLVDKNYKKVGLMPGGGYTAYVIQLYKEFFGEPQFDIYLFDSNKKLWGTENNGLRIYDPSKLQSMNLDLVLVTNYIYLNEIYDDIIGKYKYRGNIQKLHNSQDVPWVF